MFKLILDSNTKGIDIKCLEDKKAEQKFIENLQNDPETREKLKSLIEKSARFEFEM